MRIFVLLVIYFIGTSLQKPKHKGFEIVNLIKEVDDTKIVFYNFLEVENKLAVSSSRGVYYIEDENISRILNGFVGMAKYLPETKEFEKEKFPSKIYANENYSYEILNGKILVHKKSIGSKYLEGISVRTFSENFIGTYGGIYDYELKKIDDFPSYTNSYIREIDQKVFINYDGLFVCDTIAHKNYRSFTGQVLIDDREVGFALDLLTFQGKNILFTTQGVWKTDLKSELILLDSTTRNSRENYGANPKVVRVYNDSFDRNRVLYSINKQLKLISDSFQVHNLMSLDEEVLDIKPFGNNNNDFVYLTHKSIYTLKDGKQYLIGNNNEYHTLLPINDEFVALSSNEGLYKLNISSHEFTPIYIEEFNRLSLKIKRDTLLAGTIDGFYKISSNDFINFEPLSKNNSSPNLSFNLLILAIGVLIGFIPLFIWIRKKGQVEKLSSLNQNIYLFIDKNLNIVNIDLLKSHFKLSYRQLSKILENSPGREIEERRKLVAKKLFDQKFSIERISKETGYSVQYLYKIKEKL